MKETWKARLIHLLRRSEKYTKTDMVYFMKGNFWLNVNRASSVINGLVLSVAFAHLLTKEEYGTYAFVLAVMGVFSMAQTTGVASGVGKGIARGEHEIIFEGKCRILPWSLLGAVALGLTSVYYLFMGNETIGFAFLLGAIVLPISVANGIAKSFFTFKGDFGRLAKFNLVRTPIMTASLVSIAFLTQSALWILIVNILGNVILGSLLYLSMRRAYSFEKLPTRTEHFAKKYAFHSGLLSILGYLSEQLDDILLWKFSGAAPVAIYTYATTPVRELRALAENQSALALSKFAKKEFHEVRSNLGFRIKQMYIIIIPLVLAYIFAAPYIFKYLFPQYIEAVGLSQLASLSLLSSPRRLISSAISAHQKIKESYIMILFPNIVRIILAIILVPMFGIKGAIATLLISEVIDFLVLGIMMKLMGPVKTA